MALLNPSNPLLYMPPFTSPYPSLQFPQIGLLGQKPFPQPAPQPGLQAPFLAQQPRVSGDFGDPSGDGAPTPGPAGPAANNGSVDPNAPSIGRTDMLSSIQNSINSIPSGLLGVANSIPGPQQAVTVPIAIAKGLLNTFHSIPDITTQAPVISDLELAKALAAAPETSGVPSAVGPGSGDISGGAQGSTAGGQSATGTHAGEAADASVGAGGNGDGNGSGQGNGGPGSPGAPGGEGHGGDPGYAKGGIIKKVQGKAPKGSKDDGYITAQRGESVLDRGATGLLGSHLIGMLNRAGQGRGLLGRR